MTAALDRDEFLRQHPLPWTVANTLIWDGRNRLIDIGRREVRELLVDLVNRLGLNEGGSDGNIGTQDPGHD